MSPSWAEVEESNELSVSSCSENDASVPTTSTINEASNWVLNAKVLPACYNLIQLKQKVISNGQSFFLIGYILDVANVL